MGREGNESLPGGDGDSIEYVIARELCLFAAIDASRVPERERPAFVALAVRRAAPFADPESGVAWTGDGIASTWYWSRGRISELLSGRGQRARRETFVPEALHRGGQREDGAELLAMANGVEGRAWKAGRLVASRWWPQPPPFNDWQAFVRGAGLLPAQEVPAAVDAPLAAKRWGTRPAARSQGLERLGEFDRWLPQAAFVIALAVVGVLSLQVGNIVRSQYESWRVARDAEALDAPLQRILAARENADRDLAASRQLLQLRGAQPISALLAEAARVTPGDGWRMQRWSQPTADRIEATLVMPRADPQAMVAAWEESPLFGAVVIELGRQDQVSIRAEVVPRFPAQAAQ